MATAQFRSAIAEPWISLPPVRVGKLPPGLGTPDVYVVVETEDKLLRIDVYVDERCAPFSDVLIWGDFVVIGLERLPRSAQPRRDQDDQRRDLL